jgi:MYXO-CTERM domain-containing protein
MLRRSSSSIALGGAVAASLFAMPRDASACQPQLGGWFVSAAAPVPANGAVVVTYECNTGCSKEPDPESFLLKTTSGATVPGRVILTGTSETDKFVVFRPEPGELIADREYVPELGRARVERNVRVLPDVTWKTNITPTDEIFEVARQHGETVCCAGPLNSCGQAPCFSTELERKTTVRVTWDDGSSEESTQYAYRFLLDGDDTDVSWSWNGPGASFTLDETASSVCYVLELQRLADGVVHRLEDRCLEQPDDFTPGIHRRSDEAVSEELTSCNAPPPDYEAEWCAALADHCAVSSGSWCDVHADICGKPDESEPTHARAGGCAVSGANTNGRAPFLFAVGLAALGLRRRRRD